MTRKIILDPDGDVCLRLHDNAANESQSGEHAQPASGTANSKPTLDLIVSSKIMATASPVFQGMFYGKFKEGIEFAACQASSAVYVQELPDDHAKATIALCAIIHFKNEYIAEKPTPTFLVKLANLAKKYLCVQAIYLPCRLWLKHQLEVWTVRTEDHGTKRQITHATKSLCQCLYVAYILDIPEEYATIFNVLVLNDMGTSEYHGSLTEYLGKVEFRHDIRDRLAMQRAQCLAGIYDKMMNTDMMEFHCGPNMEESRATSLGRFINVLVTMKIWPNKRTFEGVSIGEIIQKVATISDKIEGAHCGTDPRESYCECQDHKVFSWAGQLVEECFSLKAELTGRSGVYYSQYGCLDCLKASSGQKRGLDGNIKQVCRVKHNHR